MPILAEFFYRKLRCKNVIGLLTRPNAEVIPIPYHSYKFATGRYPSGILKGKLVAAVILTPTNQDHYDIRIMESKIQQILRYSVLRQQIPEQQWKKKWLRMNNING